MGTVKGGKVIDWTASTVPCTPIQGPVNYKGRPLCQPVSGSGDTTVEGTARDAVSSPFWGQPCMGALHGCE